jgi:rubrerythrin
MGLTSFMEIVNFAIAREKEAVQFYVELQKIAKFSAQKAVLKEFELMEHGHVNLLMNVKKKQSASGLKPAVPPNLKLNEYLVESLPIPEMTYQDILIVAIKREEHSAALYTKLSESAEDSEIKEVFKKLLGEELKHKNHFETLYDQDIQRDN